MKVLIVEDEIYSRQSLVKQVRDFAPDIQFDILEAANGKQAWSIYQEEHPELILSDIKMPFMNGLELLKMIMGQDQNAKVIMISGYADFQYAQEALNAGAAGYLLKPVNDAALYECLQKNFQQSTHEKQIAEELKLFKNTDSLAKYIHDSINAGNVAEDYITQNMFSRMLTPYRLIFVFFSPKNYPEGSEFQMFLQDFLNKNLQAEYRMVMMSRQNWIIVAKDYNGLLERMKKLNIYMEQHGWGYWIGISERQEQTESLLAAYSQARTVIQYRLLDPNTKLFCYQEMREKHPIQNLPFEQEEKLRCYLEQCNGAGACELMQKEFYRLKETPEASVSCYDHLLLQLTAIIQKVMDRSGQRPSYSQISIHLESYDSLDELLSAVYRIIEYVCSTVEAPPKNDESTVVERVLAHIDQNYNKDISLKELAENVFFMNHTYLSHLIREKTGKNYSSYLREVRIRHAKELLNDPNLSITDVASLSGYNDSSQFIQVFKKEVGMTPKKYQELLRNGTVR